MHSLVSESLTDSYASVDALSARNWMHAHYEYGMGRNAPKPPSIVVPGANVVAS